LLGEVELCKDRCRDSILLYNEVLSKCISFRKNWTNF